MTRTALTSLLAVAALAGCGSQNSDRAGGAKPVEAKVLTMANVNGELGELEAFDEAVGRVSGGRLKIKWLNEYGSGRDGIAEVNLIRDVNAGKADLGWAGTRVFDELGVPAFNPLHAPMLIDSYELEEKVLGDGLVDPMLASLGDLELQGIGVLPGPLRRPLGKQPLRDPDDWAGDRIGSSGGEQIAAALRALGATRVLESPHGTTEGLDGFESHVAAVGDDHFHFPYLTSNIVLWPRPLVLFAGPDVSSDDLAVLRKAAKEAIPETIALSRSLEREGLSEICPAKLEVVTASVGQLDGLRAAFRPVYRRAGARPGGEPGCRAHPGAVARRREQRGRGALPGCGQGVRRHHPARHIPHGRHPRRRAGARLLMGAGGRGGSGSEGAEGEDARVPPRVHRAGHVHRRRRAARRHGDHRLGGQVLDLPRPHHGQGQRRQSRSPPASRSTEIVCASPTCNPGRTPPRR